MYVSKEAIERVRRSHDLVAVIESRGVKLTRKGRNSVGLCPFHEDKTPSLVVNPDRQLWNCFGACKTAGGKSGGDVFAFVARADGVSFIEALKRLGYEEPAEAAGEGTRPRRGDRCGDRPTLREPLPSALSEGDSASMPTSLSKPSSPRRPDLLRRVVEHYHRVFRESAAGQDYLARRGFVDPEMLAAFEVGYVDGSLLGTVDAGGEIARALRKIGILTARGRELFAGCVVFPLALPDVGVVGLYGRHALRDQHLYLPGPRRGVFHWQAMKASSEIVFTESVIDALSFFQVGIRNVSAIYGTQGFTDDHAELLQRFRVKRVVLMLDGDTAGRAAEERIGERITKLGIEVAVARLEEAKDPNQLLVKLGAEVAAQIFRKAISGASLLTVNGTVKEKNDTAPATAAEVEGSGAGAEAPAAIEPAHSETVEAGASAAPEAAAARAERARSGGGPKVTREDGGGWCVSFPERSYRVRGLAATGLDRLKVNLRIDGGGRMHLDTLDLYSHRARSALVKELARLFEREEEEIAREVGSLIETLEGLRVEMARKGAAEASGPGRIEIPDREREDALRLLRAPDLMDRILADFERVGCVGEKTTLTVGYLGTISRLLDDPLGLMIVSRSGAGKSSIQEALCEFVPEEDLVHYTRLTGQALFYKEEDSLVHKVLAIDEEKGAEEAAYSIRNLQSAQMLSIAATRTDPQTGKLRTEEYRVRGPVFIMFTTTSPEALDYETRNRFVQAGIDESAEQTRRILIRQREADTLDGILRREEAASIRRRHHNLQRLLRPLRVVNPYAPALSYPDERLQMRREQKKYLTLIK
ncbi:MAG: CHC2 zinc finger domain-containing protein, partial [Thermoanaerobaculia bacterium]